MSGEEIALVETFLRPDMRVLEWGCGGSTVFFAPKVKEYISVEHDPNWWRRFRSSGLDIRLVEPLRAVPQLRNYVPGYYQAFQHYVEAPRRWAPFDAVLIDGRARLFCAIEALQHLLKPDGLLFFHDFFARRRYRPFLLWSEPIAEVRSGQTLAVFRKIAAK